MSMLDDMIVNAKSAADAVGKTASKLVDISKLRISVADLNAEINKKYEQLGRAIYEAKKAGVDFEQIIDENVTSIDDLKEQLAAVNAQLASARQKTVCSYCGHENNPDAVFCGKCGHKLDGGNSDEENHPEE